MENELHQDPATPEEIWNILRAVGKQSEEVREQMKDTDRRRNRPADEGNRPADEGDRPADEGNRPALEETG